MKVSPSNHTGDELRRVTYRLDGRYRSFTTTVTGRAATREPDTVRLAVFTNTLQADGTMVRTPQGAHTAVVNAAGGVLTVRVSRAQELELEIGCERPHALVVLSDPRLTG